MTSISKKPNGKPWSRALDELISLGEELGALLGRKCVRPLGIAPGQAQSYGKAAIVGDAGELEDATCRRVQIFRGHL